MGVHELRSQAARTDSGVILQSVDRETMQVRYGGRVMDVQVERGIESYAFYFPPSPLWDDGLPIGDEELDVIKQAIVEVQGFWGFRVDFLLLEV